MVQPPAEIPSPRRDGTSQLARLLATRIVSDRYPDGVGIDERTTRDLLTFLRGYVEKVTYYDADNDPVGDWSGLLGELSDDQILAFIDNPGTVSDDRLRRPHLVLLLALFKLLDTARNALNGIVPRHLDYYYRDVLRLAPKLPVPDRAFVLFDLANGAHAVQIPAGTRLPAGRDSAKRERFFRTDADVVVNRAKVSRLATVFTDKLVIGLPEARDPRKGALGTKEDRFLAMLRLALGEPSPGGPLPLYGGKPVTYPLLQSLAALVAFAPTALHLQHYELRELIDRKRTRDNAGADWARINAILQAAGRDARRDPNFVLNPANPRDFNANLATALNGTPNLAGLPEITTVDDLYVQRYRQDVQDAITQKLHMPVATFVTMMDLKRASDADWRVINGLLEHAGQDKRKDSNYRLKVIDPADFATNMKEAIGTIDYTPTGATSIDGYAAAVRNLEAYAFMSAEAFAAMMATADQPEANVSERAWQQVYGTLEDALQKKVIAARRDAVRKRREAAADPATGLQSILADAAGASPSATTPQLLEELKDWASAADMQTLRRVADAPKTASTEQWVQVYDILERASRKRTQLPIPRPERQDWLNLYPQADATTVHPSAELEQRWKTFGAAPAQSPEQPPPESIGLVIGSPLFALSAGTRQIILTFGFYDDGGGPIVAAPEQPFSVQVSTADGWVTLGADKVEMTGDGAVDYSKLDDIAPIPGTTTLIGLRVRLTLPTTMPAIAPLPGDQALASCPWPAVRLMLRQIWDGTLGRWVIRYARLRSLRIARIHMRAAIGSYVQPAQSGEPLGPLVLENDLGPLDGKRPFEPFGPQPDAGATFWIGHPDLQNKRLRAVKLRLDWMGGPPDLNATYAAYQLAGPFTAKVSLVDGPLVTAQGGAGALFVTDRARRTQDASKPQTLEIASVSDAVQAYTLPPPETAAATARNLPHALRLELAIGFGHRDYAGLAATKAIALAVDTAVFAKSGGTINAASYTVGLPYAPKLKSLTLDLLAGHEIRMEAYQQGLASDMVFHLHPFGIAELSAAANGSPLLPDYGNEGELLIGLEGLRPPETLSLLFQMAEGSAKADVDPPAIRWSVLDRNGWVDLPGEAMLQDGTRGLINSGIIAFALPQAVPDARLPAGPYWLRASAAIGAAAVCDTIAIHPQAALATRELNASTVDLTPLPPKTIKSLFAPLPGIAAVHQPYASFGGRPAEDPVSFHASSSERLRHKQRAVTAWDYERLVLRRFPEIYKVKCLPATSNEAAIDRRDALGLVRLIVIPDIRGKSLFDPFEPKAASALLADVAAYLTPLLPGSARLSVENARYVQVRIRVGVRFVDQSNPALWKERLNEDLNRFLSPWAFDDGADIMIGRRIYASSIVNFIDQRSYVDYVAGIKLFSSEDGEVFTLAPPGGPDGDSVGSERPDAVLVAARRHEIDLIADEIFPADQFKGINYMKIELDFIIG
ncbi:hypothetical protein HL667_27785 [Bradyrhizobium sp. 83012]|uniref:Baseplate protein J-like domain-containing protein n=1 Tax=Bradyrhizobium aeschynomenes TaxID=2734909 RepID=A0ABX2CNI9_9BRAD|nr:hypothetical protein [Bradyrhizobium aeschynomenes]NPU68832.1 hypothetical protein [Bradyrhizobium aeschynomenes]